MTLSERSAIHLVFVSLNQLLQSLLSIEFPQISVISKWLSLLWRKMMIAMMNWNTLGIEKVAANKIASYKAKRAFWRKEVSWPGNWKEVKGVNCAMTFFCMSLWELMAGNGLAGSLLSYLLLFLLFFLSSRLYFLLFSFKLYFLVCVQRFLCSKGSPLFIYSRVLSLAIIPCSSGTSQYSF